MSFFHSEIFNSFFHYYPLISFVEILHRCNHQSSIHFLSVKLKSKLNKHNTCTILHSFRCTLVCFDCQIRIWHPLSACTSAVIIYLCTYRLQFVNHSYNPYQILPIKTEFYSVRMHNRELLLHIGFNINSDSVFNTSQETFIQSQALIPKMMQGYACKTPESHSYAYQNTILVSCWENPLSVKFNSFWKLLCYKTTMVIKPHHPKFSI